MKGIKEKHESVKIKLFQQIELLLQTNVWSWSMIKEASAKAALDIGYCHILFPEGILQIVDSFENWLDNNMLNSLMNIDKPQKIREKISLALEIRIINLIPKSSMLNSSSFFLLPSNIPLGIRIGWRSCDLIWQYAGDQSVDFNYYTKRALLFTVYASAKAFYFADNTPENQATKDFIKNELDNIIKISSFKKNIRFPKMEDIPIIRLFS